MEIFDIDNNIDGVRFAATCEMLDSNAMMIRTKAPVDGITLIVASYDRPDLAFGDNEVTRNHVVELLKKLQEQYELVKKHLTQYRSLNRYIREHEEDWLERLDKESQDYQESLMKCRKRLKSLYLRVLQRAFNYLDISETSPYFIQPYLLDQLVKHIENHEDN